MSSSMEPKSHAKQFRGILDELDQTHMKKISEYGMSRYNPNEANFNLKAVFYDIDRKYIRLRHQMEDPLAGVHQGEDPLRAIRESFMDLASYGIMGMQIIDIMQGETERIMHGEDVC